MPNNYTSPEHTAVEMHSSCTPAQDKYTHSPPGIGSKRLDDYLLPGTSLLCFTDMPELKDAHQLKAPVFHGGIPLPKSVLVGESQSFSDVNDKRFQRRISRPVPMMRIEYDVVVIGSGYGGGVAASRMARAGKSVCLLELGKERWPGEFPVDVVETAPEVHLSGIFDKDEKLAALDAGDSQGLLHIIIGEGQNAVVANGLGGTSLLNANVFLEADHRSISQSAFPPEIRQDPNELNKYYARAREVLQPEQYPQNEPKEDDSPEKWPELPKLNALEEQARRLGKHFHDRFSRVPITTTFKDGYNNMGVYQHKSTLTGQDCTGINDGSKNSTLMNYLPDAWNHGAEIFCGCEVRYIRPVKKGKNKWTVHFAWHGDKRGEFKDDIYTELMWVQAKEFVFLGAGTFGTTEILLRSKAYGLKMSPTVGTNMSGNGDILAFAYNTDQIVNGIGTENKDYLEKHPVGPCITGIIDMRDEEVAPSVLDGYVIEEGVVPEALAHVLGPMLRLTPDKVKPHNRAWEEVLRSAASKLKSDLKGPWKYDGALNRTLTYLIMSHDDNQAYMSLENNKPALRFNGVARSKHIKFLDEILAAGANKLHGTFERNPFYSPKFGGAEITVHPIGGANMSSDGTGKKGVTNHLGQVFQGEGKEVYDGLVVVDGAVVPAALGVNPFATITALAERSVEKLAVQKGWHIDYDTANGKINFAQPKKSFRLADDMKTAQEAIANSAKTGGARFTECMKGFLHVGNDIEDFEIAAEAAKGASSVAKFYLSVDAWDINTLIHKDNHAAMLTGTFSCGALSKSPFMVLRGDFQLFSDDPNTPDTKNLIYDFDMISTSGEEVHFHGYKVIDPSVCFSIGKTWKAATTLYITLSRPDNSILGRGILWISKKNFADQMLTFDGIGDHFHTRLWSQAQFLSYFTERLSNSFFAPVTALQYPAPQLSGYFEKTRPTETIPITASDGVKTEMQMWVAHDTVAQKMPILLVPGASVDYQIFHVPTLPSSFVDYLLERGYTVYCINHRVGKVSAAREPPYPTSYDARLDIAAATEYILKASKAPKIYAVVHCAGAEAMAMGLLDGTIKGIGGLTASQVFMHPWFAKVNNCIARWLPNIPKFIEKTFGPWYEVDCGQHDGLVQDLINQSLRFYPVGGKDETCDSAVCHRTELVFGRLWTHKNFNDATHTNLDKLIGGVSMRHLHQLMYMGSHGHVVNNKLENLVTTESIERLKGIPIFFVHGEKNTCYAPESTMMSYDSLQGKFGADSYQRWVVKDYGHLDCWMGKRSYQDVYPRVEQHAMEMITKHGLRNLEQVSLTNGV